MTRRRDFLVQAGLGCTALLHGGGCGQRSRHEPSTRSGAFPTVVASGRPFDFGVALGAASRVQIHRLLKRRAGWFTGLKRFALADRALRLDPFVAATRRHHPAILAELQGLAQGAGLPLDDILVLNLQPELGALKAQCERDAARKKVGCGDCSTLQLAHGGRLLLAHNEDDHDASKDLMLLVRGAPEGRPRFVSLVYPGVIPGNVPAMNDAGLIRTTNFIGAVEVRPGIPRYVLGRALLEARTLEEGIRLVVHPAGAYAFHVNLGSSRERRLVSIEVAPGGVHDVRETRSELYVHTNHFVLPKTRAVPQIATYAGGSSDSRYRVLTRAVGARTDLGRVGARDLLRLLASHDAIRAPYSPCRHPKGAVLGRTVATALFDVGAGRFTLVEGNPCRGRRREAWL